MILIFVFLLHRTSARLCYQCASELALINWSRYGLPLHEGDSMMADDACLDDARLPGYITCTAPCMTINITAVGGKHDGKVIGIVRDCQTYFLSPKSLPEGTARMCRHRERNTMRNERVNVTFCYCQGNLCNGNHSPIHLRRAAQRIDSGFSNASTVVRCFLTYFALTSFFLVMS